MRPPVGLAASLILLVGLIPFGAGCSDSSAPRSVLHLISANDNQPLQSDVLKLGTGGTGTVVEDVITLEVQSNPHDGALDLTRGEPYGYVVLDHYEIVFESSEQIPNVSGALGWTVHTGETFSGDLVIVPASWKTMPPLVGLAQGGEILATAHITLTGHEATSQDKVTVEGSVPVHFANWTDF